MGHNAYFTYVVVQGLGFSWQSALGAVFISGLCFLVVTLTGLRALIVEGSRRRCASPITVGIGLFLAIIALKNAGLVAASPATFVSLGDLHKPEAILAVIGFLMVAVLSARKVRAALLSSIPDRDGAELRLRGQHLPGHRLAAALDRPDAVRPGHHGSPFGRAAQCDPGAIPSSSCSTPPAR